MTMDTLIILGAGGHARSVANVALSCGFLNLLFIDDNAKENETIFNFPVVKSMPSLNNWACIPAAGDNHRRQKQFEHAKDNNWPLVSIISPHAIVGRGSSIAEGTFIAHFAHIGPLAKIGVGCIINTGAIVEHECQVGNFSHVSVNATLAGRSKCGDVVFLGAGATVIDGITIGGDITVGAGSVVTQSLENSGTYVGAPVRLLVTSHFN